MLDFSPVIDALALLQGMPGIYTPREGEPVSVLAIPGRASQDATPNRAIRAGQRSQDWLISVSHYAPDPKVGDTLSVIYRDRETTWEVRSLGQSLAWEWSDRDKLCRRVHMIEIDKGDE